MVKGGGSFRPLKEKKERKKLAKRKKWKSCGDKCLFQVEESGIGKEGRKGKCQRTNDVERGKPALLARTLEREKKKEEETRERSTMCVQALSRNTRWERGG